MDSNNLDGYGRYKLSSDQLADLLYKDPTLSFNNIKIHDPDQYNKTIKHFHLDWNKLDRINFDFETVEDFDRYHQNEWFMPDEYKTYDIGKYLLDCCRSQEEIDRVKIELDLFRQHNMINILRYLKYLVDVMRENKIVWGVGRGSSVASFCLYLLGVHKINSLTYNLDINEFLR